MTAEKRHRNEIYYCRIYLLTDNKKTTVKIIKKFVTLIRHNNINL